MTSPELRLATKGAATLGPGIAMKAVVYRGLGKRGWEEKSLPMIQDPGDAIGADCHFKAGLESVAGS